MIVNTGLVHENLMRAGARSICHEDGIARVGSVIRQARAIPRPCDILRLLAEENARLTANQRHRADRTGRIRIMQPNLRSIAREAYDPQRPTQILLSSLCQIEETSGAHAAEKDIEWTVPIGKECHELSIGGNGRIPLRSWKVGETRELSVSERVLQRNRRTVATHPPSSTQRDN